jgi:hypothetical protein
MVGGLMAIDGSKPLHQLSKQVDQLSFMAEHSQQLLQLLDVEIERTYACSPRRVQGYLLDRSERRNPVDSQRERLLEKAIWKEWNQPAFSQHGKPFIASTCHHIQTFQMPLQGRRTDKSWGKIDLVGVTDCGLPAILELKKEKATDTPLRMVIEGLAYAVAVRWAWNEGCLRKEWMNCVTLPPNSPSIPKTLLDVPVIGIAPTEFWKRKVGVPGKRSENMVSGKAWGPFRELCEACSERGFPISFAQFDAPDIDSTGLPIIQNISSWMIPIT